MAEKIELEITGKDAGLASTIKQSVQQGVAQGQQAADQGVAVTGKATRPRFDQQMQADRNAVAGRFQAERDRQRRQENQERVDRLAAERENQRLARQAREGAADQGVGVYGPSRAPRGYGRGAAEQAQRDALAKKLREQRTEESLGTLDKLKGAFGRGSMFKELTELAVGGGVVAGLTIAADQTAKLFEGLNKARLETGLAKRDIAEINDELVRSVPVLGQIYSAGRAIRESITGDEYAAAITRDRAAVQDDVTARIKAMSKVSRDWEAEAQKAIRAVATEQAAQRDPNDRGRLERNASLEERIADIRKQAKDAIESRRQANEEKLAELRTRRDRLRSQDDPSVKLGAVAQGFAQAGPIGASIASLRTGISGDERRMLSQMETEISRLEAAQGTLGSKIGDARDKQIKAERDRNYLELRASFNDDPTGDKALARGRYEEQVGRDMRRSRLATDTAVDVARLQRGGFSDLAAIRAIRDQAVQERQARLDANRKAFEDGQESSLTSARLREELAAQLIDIDRRRDSALEDLATQRRRREEDEEQAHANRLGEDRAAAAQIRLQAAGRTIEAEKVQYAQALRARLQQIEDAREKELRLHAENADAINKRAGEDRAAAADLFAAQSAALLSRPGVGPYLGGAGGESRLGARLTAADTYITPARDIGLENQRKAQETMSSMLAELKKLASGLPQSISDAISRSLTPAN